VAIIGCAAGGLVGLGLDQTTDGPPVKVRGFGAVGGRRRVGSVE
jgi:hypothetical protein